MVKIAFKILTFALICLWILSYLAVSFLTLTILTDAVSCYWPGDWIQTFVVVWYTLTVVITAALVALVGFRFVGKWVRE